MIQTRRMIMLLASVLALSACAQQSSPPPQAAASNGPLVRGVSYVGISVSDLDRSETFYRSATGMAEVDRSSMARNAAIDTIAGRKNVAAETRLLQGGNAQIRLMHFKDQSAAARATPPMKVNGPGITHVCHQSPQARPLYPRFAAAGAVPVTRGGKPMRLVPEVPWSYIYARDPDGVLFENEIVETNPPPPFGHRVGHVALATTDIERSVAFYTALLGREPRERRSNLARPTLDQVADLDNVKLNVAWYTVGNLELEIWQYLSPAPAELETPRPIDALGYNMIVFDVADVAAATAKLSAAGGKLVGKSVEMDKGRVAFGRDPDGNLIGLSQAAGGSVFSTAKFENREQPLK